jgi:hypothetical protein
MASAPKYREVPVGTEGIVLRPDPGSIAITMPIGSNVEKPHEIRQNDE